MLLPGGALPTAPRPPFADIPGSREPPGAPCLRRRAPGTLASQVHLCGDESAWAGLSVGGSLAWPIAVTSPTCFSTASSGPRATPTLGPLRG